MSSHESGFENNLVLYFQIALFQFQYEFNKFNKDRDTIFYFIFVEFNFIE